MTPRILTPFVLLFVSSCFVNVFGDSPIPSSKGTASIRWTIDGRVEDWSCLSLNATGARVVVHDREGEVVIAREQACDDFRSTHELAEGSYTARVALLADSRAEVAVKDVSFTVEDDRTTIVDVPFETAGPI